MEGKIKIYTSEEVRDILKISKRTLQSWRDKGYIKFSQINGKILYTQIDIENFLERFRK